MHTHIPLAGPCCPHLQVSAAAGCNRPRAPAAHAQREGQGCEQQYPPWRGKQAGSKRHCRSMMATRKSLKAAASSDDADLELESASRRTVVLPWWLNSPGKTFCLAGLLKILVIMSRAVPWAGVTTPYGLEAAATMVPFGIVLVLLARAAVDRGLTLRWWLTPLLLLSAGAFLYAQQRLFPPKRMVPAAPDPAIMAARERRQQMAAARRKLPTAQDADRLWDKYEKAKAAQAAAEQSRAHL